MQDHLIARVKAEISKIRYADQGRDPLLTAVEEIEGLKSTTAAATSDILNIAEALLGQIQRIRETGPSEPIGDIAAGMEEEIGRLFEVCGFQDLTGQRSTRVSRLLEGLDAQVGSALDLMEHVEVPDDVALEVMDRDLQGEAALLHGPQNAGDGLEQDDIDSLFSPHSPDEAAT